MDRAFQLAIEPREHIAFRLGLQPLTLGHAFLILRHTPKVILGGETRMDDLLQSVFICSQPWRQSKKDLRRWWMSVFLPIWGKLLRKHDLQKEAAKFSDYLNDNLVMPTIKSGKRPLVEMGTPWPFRVQAFLMGDMHISYDRTYDVPVTLANCWFAAVGEMKHGLELWTQSDEDFWQYARQQDRAKARN